MPPTVSTRSYYIFGLPDELKRSLRPFKVSLEEESPEVSTSDSDSDEYSSESESEEVKEGPKHRQTNNDEEDEELWKITNYAHIHGSPYVNFTSSLLEEGKVLSIFKCALDRELVANRSLDALEKLQPEGKSAVLLVGGGHFAGAIISHKRGNHKTNISNPFANIFVLESKSFHRYTVRRKQGGAQSASDNAHGKANSAGSTIRRANERMLQQEIHQLLESWKDHLKDCYRIFYRASGKSNRGLIFGYPNAVIDTRDERLSQIPFATGRPTYDECRRVWLQITRARVQDAPHFDVVQQREAAAKAVPEPAAPSPTPQKPKEIPVEERLSRKIVDLVKRSRLAQLKQLYEENKLSWDFELQPAQKFLSCPTALLYAATLDKQHVVISLLQWGASPTVRSHNGQTLGEIASPHEKTSRALQDLRSKLGEAFCDWNGAKVGPPMTKEEFLASDTEAKLKLRDERNKEVHRQDAAEKHEKLEKLIAKHGTGRATGGTHNDTRGLSEEELRHVERERRARAAEARMKRLGGK